MNGSEYKVPSKVAESNPATVIDDPKANDCEPPQLSPILFVCGALLDLVTTTILHTLCSILALYEHLRERQRAPESLREPKVRTEENWREPERGINFNLMDYHYQEKVGENCRWPKCSLLVEPLFWGAAHSSMSHSGGACAHCVVCV